MKKKYGKEIWQGFSFLICFFLLILGLVDLESIMRERQYSKLIWQDMLRRGEGFLCPWTCPNVGGEKSVENAAVSCVLPMAAMALQDAAEQNPLFSGSAEKSVENINDLLERENRQFRDLYALAENETPKESQRTNDRGDTRRGAGEWEEGELTDPPAALQEENGLMEKAPDEEEEIASEASELPKIRKTSFQPHEKVTELDLEELKDYETLVKKFYTIDPTTMAGSDQLSAEKLLEKDMRMKKEQAEPQILIYHTHSQEAFQDSVPGDVSTGIVGVGEELANILRDDYGYNVLHHTGEYDKPSRNEAYSRALPVLEKLLEEYPSIQVVIDLHRDEMPENTRLVTEIDGRKTARFMFFNGLSRNKRTGNLDYLYNAYLEENLAFSFQMEKAAQEYYPGLTRKIYLKGYRYNMHLKPRTLLIELGAQNNTLDEAMNACGPIAHLLDIVLQGEE